jgi:DNA-directed RNA polymerase subunit RPC12/RpoP
MKRLRLIFSLIYIALIAIAAVFLLPEYWYLWLMLVLIVLMRLITWIPRKQDYECTKCKTRFSKEKRRFSFVPKAADLYVSEKTLKCPNCGSSEVVLIDAKKRRN